MDLGAVVRVASPPVTGADGVPRTGTQSRYRIKLPYGNLPPARLVITTSYRVFQRRVGIEVTRPADDVRREPWQQRLADATWQHADLESDAPPLTLDLPTVDVSEVTLTVDEGDNTPLPIQSATLLLPAYAVRFVRADAKPLSLLYGRADIGDPTYDIALLAPQLIGAPATDVGLGPELTLASVAPSTFPLGVFWTILGLAVATMLFLIMRLVRKSGGTDEAIVAE
jgi:hypothetical protein